MELYRKYRPTTFSEVKGQREAVGVIRGWLNKGSVPHAIMLEGDSGCGKTTLARILANELGCKDGLTYTEMNVGVENGVAMVADLVVDSRRNLGGGNRVWVLDEVQMLTKPASNSLLKVLEEAPSYAYFVLCTTNPEKILPTLMNRCQHIKIRLLSDKAIKEVIERIIIAENREIPEEVVEAIVRYSGGSARKAVVKLEQCLAAVKPDNMLALIQQETGYDAIIRDLCAVFTGGKQMSWKQTATILDSLEEDAETIRRSVLGWLSSALVKGWARNVSTSDLADMVRIFSQNTYDSGKPQLVLMVYDAWRILNGR